MASYPEALDHMLGAWNERSPDRVRSHLEKALAPNVEFIDPSIETLGIDEFETNVHEVHRQLPGAIYERTSSVDSHHQLHRYSWQISRGDEILMSGFDVTEVDGDGQVLRVLGFFGPLPEKA
ncbi:MAG: hypothetical protein ACI8TP_001735 [Acidimicrobiales bacterium]|jgi:hypothetical protein